MTRAIPSDDVAYVPPLRRQISDKNTPVEAERIESYIVKMTVYLARNCPICRNYFGVTIAKPRGTAIPIRGRYALGHSYRINAVIFLRSSSDVNGLMM